MPTTFIANQVINLPSRFSEGDVMTERTADFLNHIHHNRLKAKLRRLIQRGDVLADTLQTKALELAAQDLVPYLTLDDDESENDPIFTEALSMARELILSRLAIEGVPPPKGLDDHARALIDGMPDLQEKARQRVEARYRVANEIFESPAA